MSYGLSSATILRYFKRCGRQTELYRHDLPDTSGNCGDTVLRKACVKAAVPLL
eukprot:CAMPEP_0119138396 /NCGR_PEP_ID=MMETSP1310-20130426/25560_1 /TAXON_ID=464262 /ORGANISM="Genus nov. species nov., Strain RCC2339" /LENGTH=52 /DNA_ID=CAMNT_0007129583 /DNA_START=202 /DNA_END=356 /DNA_ORIENTATION=-